MAKTEFDWKEVAKLCAMQCTLAEVAGFYECDPKTIQRNLQADLHINWKEFCNMHRQGGYASLRRKQWQVGVDEGDVQMLKHLGKHHLGQHDKLDLGFDPDKPVVFELQMGKQLRKDKPDDQEED